MVRVTEKKDYFEGSVPCRDVVTHNQERLVDRHILTQTPQYWVPVLQTLTKNKKSQSCEVSDFRGDGSGQTVVV